MTEKHFAKIIQPKPPRDGVSLTMGTKVMVGDVELQGVYKIVLTAEVESVWTAEIHCHPSYIDMTAMADVSVKHAIPIARRIRQWWRELRGVA